MKTRTTSFIVALTLTLGLLVSVPSANAAKPLDVDCDLLAATIVAVDTFLDSEGVQSDNVGDLFASAILDDAVFDQLSALLLFFSGGAIDFDSATQMISTVSKCRLVELLIGEIAD